MLEALVRRDTGYVINLKPTPAIWTETEREQFKICQWQDPTYDAITDIVAYPYTTYDETFTPTGESKWLDVGAVDISGTDTLAWADVEPAIRSD
jgi:hypothetical protein